MSMMQCVLMLFYGGIAIIVSKECFDITMRDHRSTYRQMPVVVAVLCIGCGFLWPLFLLLCAYELYLKKPKL